ncbi:hypothetical protein F2P81_005507 [Scophthalmus maximus]|uniref:Uncharacterized protein n=1 Tax=Scophthalmus maximus TaxID=52904 RepID=A0A6A4T9V6_SCOMX|nr:hypothetical protein F2P81_005507 [Scophthalmus maximus]
MLLAVLATAKPGQNKNGIQEMVERKINELSKLQRQRPPPLELKQTPEAVSRNQKIKDGGVGRSSRQFRTVRQTKLFIKTASFFVTICICKHYDHRSITPWV